jgi:hypothetical protein
MGAAALAIALRVFGWLRGVAALALRYPLQCAVVALMLLAAWAWRGRVVAISERDQARTEIRKQADDYRAAQAAAAVQFAAAKASTEAHYKEIADAKDQEYRAGLADARAAADRYIASHSLRLAQAAQGVASSAPATAADHSAGIPAPMPADAVMVSADDVRACTEGVTYALKAHEWATQLAQPVHPTNGAASK